MKVELSMIWGKNDDEHIEIGLGIEEDIALTRIWDEDIGE